MGNGVGATNLGPQVHRFFWDPVEFSDTIPGALLSLVRYPRRLVPQRTWVLKQH